VARSGQSIENPVAGDRMIFHETSADSEGRRLVFELVLAPGAHGPPEHIHLHQEERFRVISGRIGAKIDGRESVLDPDDEVTVPAGVKHTWWGAGTGTATGTRSTAPTRHVRHGTSRPGRALPSSRRWATSTSRTR
jgi:mannose-6-phosphate isomerase-like protein (cupin superfamily)